MSSYEANWEIPVVVTAEAVFGIGFPSTADGEATSEPSAPLIPGGSLFNGMSDDVSD